MPREAGAAALAKFVVTVMHGIAVQAASGATSVELRGVAALALQAWPKSKPVAKRAKAGKR